MKHKLNKLPSGLWELVFRPNGTAGKQVRRRFATRAEGERFAALVKAKVLSGKEWNPSPPPKDDRLLSGLVMEWYRLHGQALKSGEERKNKLLHLCEVFGNPLARHFDRQFFISQRANRLSASIHPNTTNHDLAYLKAMFNDLRRDGVWQAENPLALVKKIKVDETEMAFLSTEQITELLHELKKSQRQDAYLVSKLCLATGARWREAETLTANDVKNGLVRYGRTKSGKGRAVPISAELEREVKQNCIGMVPLFSPCMDLFREALARCSFTLPRGQATHVLRHTFASYYIQNGGNIIELQKILGHSTIVMTMRYAHLAPSYMQQVLTLNPLNGLSCAQQN